MMMMSELERKMRRDGSYGVDPIAVMKEQLREDQKPIDLRKEKPEVARIVRSAIFRLRVLDQSDLTSFSDMCEGYAFKDGKLFLTLKIDSVTGKYAMFQKKRVKRVSITHYLDSAMTQDTFKYDVYTTFSHIESSGIRNDSAYNFEVLSITLVYDITEW